MFAKKKLKLRGFSLLEFSVAILIVGILTAGVMISNRVITKTKIATAKNLTLSSPITTIPDAALWLETSLENSFNEGEASSGHPLSTWYDQRNAVEKVTVTTAGVSPTYANSINHVHAVEFDGISNKHFTFDASFLNGSDYTIFVLEKRKSANSNNYFLGSSTAGLALGYSADGTVIHAHGNNSYNSSVSTYSQSKDDARIFTFTASVSEGKKTYVNGLLTGEDFNLMPLSGITNISIGQGYIGEIGEIAIFTRALRQSEKVLIENYLSKKWSTKINRESGQAGSCIGYTVTSKGCDLSHATCNISQIGINAIVSAASNSASIQCNATGYTSSSITYTCINGVISILGNCACAPGYTGANCTTCTEGYVPAGGGTCVPGVPCSTSPVSGVVSPTAVAHGESGNLICNAPHYSGLDDVSYTCYDGVLNSVGTCNCAVGYTGSGCLSCDVGYSMVNGNCQEDDS